MQGTQHATQPGPPDQPAPLPWTFPAVRQIRQGVVIVEAISQLLSLSGGMAGRGALTGGRENTKAPHPQL